MVEQRIRHGETAELVRLNECGADLRFVQEEGSVLRLFVLHLAKDKEEAVNAEDRVTVELQGEHCTTEIYALNYLRGSQHAALHTKVLHNVGKGRSKQVVKFVLADESKGEFSGELKIAQDAQETDAQQTNRNLLLSERATMRTQPQLEIYADDVKASHGASTGQLDESALFYMRQRCLSEEEGRKMLLLAFMSDIVGEIHDESKRAEAENLLVNC